MPVTEGKGMAERSMGFGLRWLSRLAGSDLLDRIRIRKQVERALFTGTKNGFRSATAAGRTFKAAQNLGRPARQAPGKPRALFDLSPDEEQQMLQEGVRDFAEVKVRPVAKQADFDCSTPDELLAQANELGVNMLGILMRVTRSSILEVMSEDYVRTARAKGLREKKVVWRHVSSNAVIPVITVVGLELGTLLSGSIIVETVFAWPGGGSLLITALNARDYPLVTGLVLTYTTAFVAINLIIDGLYAVVDPRIRY